MSLVVWILVVYVNCLENGHVITGMQSGDFCTWQKSCMISKQSLLYSKCQHAEIHQDAIRAISIGRNGTVLTCSNDCTVQAYCMQFSRLYTIPAHDAFIYGIFRFHLYKPDVRHSKLYDVFYTSSEDKTVGIWDVNNGQMLQLISLESSVWQVCLTVYSKAPRSWKLDAMESQLYR
ncbi:bifunctional WD40 repeat/WD40-YVTN repeat-like-containing domain superfamily/WD40-repeat-containing domain superfamily [Babesia duncani]|uniref:Bifunctional WD40 repeat/WD40-YVTN repeat-like-containing domain superfamily/WD40-repeat-containing domain superfamily n=1 Tax=Babesia duncani TaxID=323732 RepID=A0AAD9PN84_9APIC|nr:bifunctional WD40 repeat/WD40-YVTN repeat-like-containing domain superfamily/WD40-repeat-containing domain superfamily [Babesia duncani]